jgi:hypothetical protein
MIMLRSANALQLGYAIVAIAIVVASSRRRALHPARAI